MLHAMSFHASNVEVVREVCKTVGPLLAGETSAGALAEERQVQLLVNALTTHITDADACHWVCIAVSNLAKHDARKSVTVRCGGIACRALNDLAIDGEAKRSIIKAGSVAAARAVLAASWRFRTAPFYANELLTTLGLTSP